MAMDLSMKDNQVVLTMSPEEWSGFQSAFTSAWRFIADSVKNSIPSGRTFGKAQLDDDLAGTDRAVMALNERISRLENRLQRVADGEPFEVWTDRQLEKLAAILRELDSRLDAIEEDEEDDRLIRLERRVSDLARRLTDETTRINALRSLVHEARDGMASLSEQGNTDRDRLNETVGRLSGLENKFNSHLQWAAQHDHPDSLNDRLSELENRLDTYGVPVVGRPPDSQLDDAERQVRRYMAKSFSEGTIGGVVQALRGEPSITDHAFLVSAQGRRHCSYQSDSEDEKCGALRSEHQN